jgi:hypothetical protein
VSSTSLFGASERCEWLNWVFLQLSEDLVGAPNRVAAAVPGAHAPISTVLPTHPDGFYIALHASYRTARRVGLRREA